MLPAWPLATVLQQVLLQNSDKWICKYLTYFNIYFKNKRHWIDCSGGKRSREMKVESRELERMPVADRSWGEMRLWKERLRLYWALQCWQQQFLPLISHSSVRTWEDNTGELSLSAGCPSLLASCWVGRVKPRVSLCFVPRSMAAVSSIITAPKSLKVRESAGEDVCVCVWWLDININPAELWD